MHLFVSSEPVQQLNTKQVQSRSPKILGTGQIAAFCFWECHENLGGLSSSYR